MSFDKKPLISVIIPVYNVEKFLKRCVDSVLNQTYENIEIILVDDGSEDMSPAICDEYATADARIRVVHKDNGGSSTARNEALRIMNGEFVCFVDSDDFVSCDYIMHMYNLLLKYNCDIVQTNFIEVFDSDMILDERKEKIEIFDKYSCLTGFKYKVSACGKLYKRSVIEGIFFPEGTINEDDATYYRFAYKCDKICVSDKILYYYFQTQNSVMRNKKLRMDFMDVYRERLRFFKKLGEELLVKKSYERYALILILKYLDFEKKEAEKEYTDKLLMEFSSIYKESICSASFKYKPVIFMFKRCPWLTVKIMRAIRK